MIASNLLAARLLMAGCQAHSGMILESYISLSEQLYRLGGYSMLHCSDNTVVL
jgi:hypothetical protein